MKVRIPKHREFVIEFQEEGQKQNEGWAELQKILRDYEKQGKSIYTETFIEDNEEKVKALQAKYNFTYKIECVK